MIIFKLLKTELEGRGFFASFLTISGFVYVFVLIIVLIFQVILLFTTMGEGEE
jgi:hypothetical protein